MDTPQSDKADSLPELFARFGIRGRPGKALSFQPGTQTLDCPRCQANRKGSKSPSLHLKVDADSGGAVWSCFNAGDCEWNAPQAHRLKGAGHSTGMGPPPARSFKKPPTDHLQPADAGLYRFFADRGISREVVDRCGVRSAVAFMPQTGRKEWVIAFPYELNGELVNFKYRTADKKFRQEKDALKCLWRADSLRGQARGIITEGEADAMALLQAGFDAVASVPDGAPERVKEGDPDPADPKFSYLRTAPELFAPADQGGVGLFVLALDNDGPGRVLEAELGRRIGLDRCLRVRWPDGCKDAGDVLRRHGADALRACIDQAEPFPIQGVVRVEDVWPEVEELYARGLPPGAALGWEATDRAEPTTGQPLLSLRPGELVVLTGIPGSGKSALWDAIMVNTARLHGWGWGACSLETPASRHIASLTALAAGKPFGRGPTPRMDLAELRAAGAWVREHFHFVQSDTETPTVDSILARAELLVRHFGITGLVVDPYTEVAKARGQLRDTDMVEEVLTALRDFARRHRVLACIVAHPAKPGQQAPRVPGMYDISGSAHWNNKADVGLSIFRDKENPRAPVELHIKKIRFREVGRLGVAMLAYEPAWGGYVDPHLASYPVEFPPSGEDGDAPQLPKRTRLRPPPGTATALGVLPPVRPYRDN